MKVCSNCGNQMNDNDSFCTNCGASAPNNTAAAPTPSAAGYDHTAEFTAEDIAESKIYCMAVYLLGIFGIIIAKLCRKDSAYTAFHIKQSLKITILMMLLAVVDLVLFWTIIVPLAVCICLITLVVLLIIAFCQVCGGKAVEPWLIRDLKFLK